MRATTGWRPAAVAAAIPALLALAATAAGDWLVLDDGSKVETRGAWEVRGGLVVFTLPNGTLSSLRGSQVDLEASRAATEAAVRPAEPPPPPPPRPKAKVVLTERDLPPVTQPQEGAAEPASGGGSQTDRTDPRAEVVSWNIEAPEDVDGTTVTGRLRNVSRQLLTQVSLDVLVFDAGGELLARQPARIPAGPLAPDRVIDFEVHFQGVHGVSGARFVTQAAGFLEEGGGEEAGASAETAAEAEGFEDEEAQGPFDGP